MERFSCLYCSILVSKSNLNWYKHHLKNIHNFEKHIEETIAETFTKKDEPSYGNIFSLKIVEDVMESLKLPDKKNNVIKGNIDYLKEDPLGDLITFLDETESKINNTESNPESTDSEVQCYNCEECGKTFRRLTTLKVHEKTFHTGNATKTKKETECFPRIEDANDQDIVRMEDDSSPDVEIENENPTLIERASVDDVPEQDWWNFFIFTCQLCHSKMNSKDKSQHLLQEHEMVSTTEYQEKVIDIPEDESARYQCLVCIGDVEWERSALSEHLWSHRVSIQQYQEQFSGPIARQVQKQYAKLTGGDGENLIKSDLKIQCKVCEKMFKTNFSLNLHMRSGHAGTTISNQESNNQEEVMKKTRNTSEELLNCRNCLFRTERKSCLTLHVQRYHEYRVNISCCSQTFHSRWDTFVHFQQRHRGEKERLKVHLRNWKMKREKFLKYY